MFLFPGFTNRNKPHACVQAPGVGSKIIVLWFDSVVVTGKLTRVYVKQLHFLYLPSCVIGGIYGLTILQIVQAADVEFYYWMSFIGLVVGKVCQGF